MKKHKYILTNAFLLKEIINGEYGMFSFTKLGINRWDVKADGKLIATNISTREVVVMKELLDTCNIIFYGD